MAKTIAQMTPEEFQEMIKAIVEKTVEQKLMDILGDPDMGLEIRQTVLKRLVGQQKAVAAGERGQSLNDVARDLGLE